MSDLSFSSAEFCPIFSSVLRIPWMRTEGWPVDLFTYACKCWHSLDPSLICRLPFAGPACFVSK